MIWTKFKRYDWFTLIELIIVFTIIWILGGLSFFVLTNHLIRSRDTKRKFDVNSIVMGLSMYYMQKRNYPEPSDYIKILDDKSNIIWHQWSFDVAVVNKWIPLENIPLDPQDKKDYLYTKAIDPISWKMRYEVGSLMEHYLNWFDFVSWKSFFKKYPYIFQWNAILRCSDDGQLFFPSQLSIINNKYYYFLNSSNAGDNVEVKLDLSNMTGDCEWEISAPIIDLTWTNLIININDIELTLTQ